MTIEFQWLTTAPNPRRAMTSHPDDGQRGWVRHAVMASSGETFGALKHRRAECGIRPAHGWGFDLFIERECSRCLAAIAKRA